MNGKKAPLLMTNGAFRGMVVSPGASHIVMEYRPDGGIISALSALLILAALLSRRVGSELPVAIDLFQLPQPEVTFMRDGYRAPIGRFLPEILRPKVAVANKNPFHAASFHCSRGYSPYVIWRR